MYMGTLVMVAGIKSCVHGDIGDGGRGKIMCTWGHW